MSGRPLKIPGHRPLSRPEDRERPFSQNRKDPRLGPAPRCLSRGPGRRGAGAQQPQVREIVVAREVALRRLRRCGEVHAEMRQPLTEVRRELIDVLLHLRIHSLEVVETIERWRNTGSRNGAPWIDPASGENYLLRMKNDTLWLADSPLGEILTFSPKSDPFFVVPSARDNSSQPATNQMTPTLQARRQQTGRTEQRKAVLPLQTSLFKRIHKAELLILRESVQARMSQGAQYSEPEPPLAPQTRVSPQQQDFSVAAQPPKQEYIAASQQLSEPRYDQPSLITAAREPVGRTPLPPEAEAPQFVLFPLAATEASFVNDLDHYFRRVDPRVLTCLESRQALQDLVRGGDCEGPETIEFFWLFKSSRGEYGETLSRGSNAANDADGLVAFQLKKASVSYGQIFHFSLASEGLAMDPEAYEAALVSVKWYIFSCLPIRGIRITLWYSNQADGTYNALPDLLAVFKKVFFKWFQLKNTTDGRRGQVLSRPRAVPEDGGDDPETPGEPFGIQIAWGQAWLRAAQSNDALSTRRLGSCAWNLTLAALCLHQLWDRDAAEASKIVDWDVAAAEATKATTREGVIRSLLKGELPKLLASFAPVTLGSKEVDPMSSGQAKSYASNDMSAALARYLAKSLEGGANTVPAADCQVSGDGGDLVKRLTKAGGFGDCCKGVSLESLPGVVTGMQPRDVAYGRLFISMDWNSVRAVDAQTFEVPVHAVGKCRGHPHPISYVRTTEDDMYVVIIPWANTADLPREEEAFAACSEILRGTEPLDPFPHAAIRLSGLSVAAPVRMTEIHGSSALRQENTEALHVAEFGSLLLSSGRTMPGRLLPGPLPHGAPQPLMVEKPYLLCFWHDGLDALNVPLAATLIS